MTPWPYEALAASIGAEKSCLSDTGAPGHLSTLENTKNYMFCGMFLEM